MDRNEFNDIIKSLNRKDITEEDKEFLCEALGVEKEDDVKVNAVEAFLTLASTNIDLVKKYGVYIDEYYQLPIENRKNVCKVAYKEFIKSGNFNIDVISTYIVKEVEDMEETHQKKCVVHAIQKNIKRMPERPNIDFTGCIDE